MPLDVLSQIQSFENGGQVAKNIGAIADSHPELQQAFQGAASALTNNGMDIDTENLAKVEQVMNSIVKATENASSMMYGFGNTVRSIDAKPLHEVKATMDEIATTASGVEMSVGTSQASASLSDALKKINEIKSNASANLKITASVGSGFARGGMVRQQRFEHGGTVRQNFAKGGKVTYHRQNTETARTGGIFRQGSSTGDRNMIFANKGEGIITEKAMRQGAKQRGMSPESYIQALNHPSTNLRKIKKGRSFEYGGKVGDKEELSRINDFKQSVDAYTPKSIGGSAANEELKSLIGKMPDFDENNKSIKEGYEKLNNILKNFSGGVNSDQDAKEMRDVFSKILKEIEDGNKKAEEDAKKDLEQQKKNKENEQKKTVENAKTSAYTGISKGVKNIDKGISSNMKSSDVIKESGTTKDEASALRKQSSETSKQVKIKIGSMNEDEKSVNGIKFAFIQENIDNIQKVLNQGTEEDTQLLLAHLNKEGIVDPETLIQLLKQASDDMGKMTDEQIQELTKIGGILPNINIDEMMGKRKKEIEEAIQKELDELSKSIEEGIRNGDYKGLKMSVNAGDMMQATENAKKGKTNEEKESLGKAKRMFKSSINNEAYASVVEGAVQQGKVKDKSGQKITSMEGVKKALEDDTIDVKSLGALADSIENVDNVINDVEDTVKDFGDVFQNVIAKRQKEIEGFLKNIPLIGEGFRKNMPPVMQFAAVVAFGVKTMYNLSKSAVNATVKIAEFTAKQAEIGKGMAQLKSVSSGLFDGANIEKFKDSMNLTREQAAGLAESFRKAGMSGETSFANIETIAQNIKDQFGQLDTSLLQEAVNLINDLPQQQIDVLVNGKGSLDDEASLVANLMESGKLDMAAELITKGAFGEVEGLTPEMSEADKRTLEAQAEIKQVLDDMYASVNEYLGFLGPISQYVAGVLPVVGAVASGIMGVGRNIGQTMVSVKATESIFKGVKGGNSINVTDTSASKGINAGDGGGKSLPDGNRPTGGGGRAGAIGASVVAIAIQAIDKIGDHFDKKANEERESDKIATNRSINENKEKYGIAVSTEGPGLARQAKKDQAMGNAMHKAADWGKWGMAIGAGIGSFIPALGTAVGAAVGGAIGAVAGAVSGMVDYFSEEGKDQRKNGQTYEKIAQMQEEGNKLEKEHQKLLQKQNGMSKKDMQRGIVELSRIQKVTKKIADGALTQQHEMKKKAYKTNINLISKIGGKGADVRTNASSIAKETVISTKKDLSMFNKMNQKILNSNKMTAADKEMGIASNMQQMSKIFDRFLDGLENAAIKYETLPEIIIAGLENELKEMTIGRSNKQMVGNSSENLASSLSSLSALGAGLKELSEGSKANDENLRETIKGLESAIESSKVDISEQEKNLVNAMGGIGVKESKGNAAIRNQNMKIINEKTLSYEDRMREAVEKYGEPEAKQKIEDFNEKSGAIGKMQEKLAGVDEKDWENKEKQNDLKAQAKQTLEDQVENIRSAMEGMDTKSEGYKQLQNQLKVTEKAIGKIDEAESAHDIRVQMDAVGLGAKNSTVAMQTDVLRNVQNDPEVQKLVKEERALYEQMKLANAAYMTQISASDALVVKKRQEVESTKKMFEQMDKFSSGVSKIMDALLKNANLEFASTMKQNAETSFTFDAMSRGGASVGASVTGFEADSVVALFEGVGAAQEYLAEAQKQFDEFTSDMAKNMPTDTAHGSNEATKYLELLAKSSELKTKAMQNPTDAAAVKAAKEASDEAERYFKKNKEAVEDYAKTHETEYNKAKGSINGLVDANKQLATSTAEAKKKFVELFQGINSAVENAVKNDYGVMSQTESVNVASAKYEMAKGNASVSQMTEGGGALVQESADLAAKEYEVTKSSWDKQIAVVEEKLKDQNITKDEYDKQMAILVKKKEADLTQKRLEGMKKVGESVTKMADGLQEKLGRVGEGLEIQKDLYETIGAPFEYVLDIEKQMVKNAKAKAQAEEASLAEMEKQREKGLVTEEDYEKQKLRVAKANAEVIKSAYGAQRSAVDKLLGSMMGTFQQIGGVFGPDSDFAKARKYGQGYTEQSNGLVTSSEGNVSSYAERVAGLSATATAGSPAPKMNRGDMDSPVAGAVSGMVNGGGKKKKKKKKGGSAKEEKTGDTSVKNEDTSDVKKGTEAGSTETTPAESKEGKKEVPNDTEGLLKLILKDTNEIVRLLKEGSVVTTSAPQPATGGKAGEKPKTEGGNKPGAGAGTSPKTEGEKAGASPKTEGGNKPGAGASPKTEGGKQGVAGTPVPGNKPNGGRQGGEQGDVKAGGQQSGKEGDVKASGENGTAKPKPKADWFTRRDAEKKVKEAEAKAAEKQQAFKEAEQAEEDNNKKIEELTNNREMHKTIKKKEAKGQELTEEEKKFKEEHSGSNALEADEQALKEAKAKRSELRKNKMKAHKEAQTAKKKLDEEYKKYEETTGDKYVSQEEAVESEEEHEASIKEREELDKKLEKESEQADKDANVSRERYEAATKRNREANTSQSEASTTLNSEEEDLNAKKAEAGKLQKEYDEADKKAKFHQKSATELLKQINSGKNKYGVELDSDQIERMRKAYDKHNQAYFEEREKREAVKGKLDEANKRVSTQEGVVKEAREKKEAADKEQQEANAEFQDASKDYNEKSNNVALLDAQRRANRSSIELDEMEHYGNMSETQVQQLEKDSDQKERAHKEAVDKAKKAKQAKKNEDVASIQEQIKNAQESLDSTTDEDERMKISEDIAQLQQQLAEASTEVTDAEVADDEEVKKTKEASDAANKRLEKARHYTSMSPESKQLAKDRATRNNMNLREVNAKINLEDAEKEEAEIRELLTPEGQKKARNELRDAQREVLLAQQKGDTDKEKEAQAKVNKLNAALKKATPENLKAAEEKTKQAKQEKETVENLQHVFYEIDKPIQADQKQKEADKAKEEAEAAKKKVEELENKEGVSPEEIAKARDEMYEKEENAKKAQESADRAKKEVKKAQEMKALYTDADEKTRKADKLDAAAKKAEEKAKQNPKNAKLQQKAQQMRERATQARDEANEATQKRDNAVNLEVDAQNKEKEAKKTQEKATEANKKLEEATDIAQRAKDNAGKSEEDKQKIRDNATKSREDADKANTALADANKKLEDAKKTGDPEKIEKATKEAEASAKKAEAANALAEHDRREVASIEQGTDFNKNVEEAAKNAAAANTANATAQQQAQDARAKADEARTGTPAGQGEAQAQAPEQQGPTHNVVGVPVKKRLTKQEREQIKKMKKERKSIKQQMKQNDKSLKQEENNHQLMQGELNKLNKVDTSKMNDEEKKVHEKKKKKLEENIKKSQERQKELRQKKNDPEAVKRYKELGRQMSKLRGESEEMQKLRGMKDDIKMNDKLDPETKKKKLKEINKKIKAQKKSEKARASAEKKLAAEAAEREKEGGDSSLSDVKDELVTSNQQLGDINENVKKIIEGKSVKEPEGAPKAPTPAPENGQPATPTPDGANPAQPANPEGANPETPPAPAPNEQNPPNGANPSDGGTAPSTGGGEGGGTGEGGTINKTLNLQLKVSADGSIKGAVTDMIKMALADFAKGFTPAQPTNHNP